MKLIFLKLFLGTLAIVFLVSFILSVIWVMPGHKDILISQVLGFAIIATGIGLPGAFLASLLGCVFCHDINNKFAKFCACMVIANLCGFYGTMMWPIVLISSFFSTLFFMHLTRK